MKKFFFVFLIAFLTACSSLPTGTERSPADPWEPFNRSIFSFNEGLDDYVLKPITEGYRFVLPKLVREGISNFFSNYRDIYTALNNLLQGNIDLAFSDLMRVMVNTIFGLGGTIDMATPAGLEKHTADFGQTFGVWGVPSGPYVVLPFFGPSSVRDTFGTAADLESDYLFSFVSNIGLRNTITGIRVVNARNNYFEAGELVEGAAIDKYSFLRDSYIQRRQYQIDKAKQGEETKPPVYENMYE
ncbi:MAG: VacJ family lipoprotein [Polynucleobacter sp.]|nr:VacJ family lipoprotein [Polynucleobacter sp.]